MCLLMEEDHAKEKWKTMDVIPRNPWRVFLLVFVIVMIAIYIRTGGIPDTLCKPACLVYVAENAE